MAKYRMQNRKIIKQGQAALKEIMQTHLTEIADAMLRQIMARAAVLPDSRKIDAIKNVRQPGVNAYKEALLGAMSSIALDALRQARSEIPNARTLKLSEELDSITLSDYDKLPPKLKKKIKAQSDLTVQANMGDLSKALAFQYTHSQELDSELALENDMSNAAADFISGPAVEAGSNLASAKIVNDARYELLTNEELDDSIDAYLFVNDDPVTNICQELAGQIFPKDDPNLNNYWPPLHWNCKSTIEPILKGDLGNREVKNLSPSKAAAEQIQFDENHHCPGCSGH